MTADQRKALQAWSSQALDGVKDWGNRAEALDPADPLLAGLAESIARMSRAFAARADEVLRRRG